MSNNEIYDILNSLPKSIRNVIVHQLSPESLKNKFIELSPNDRKQLEEIKRELKLKTDEDTIDYLISGISGVATPSDRLLLPLPLMEKIDKLNRVTYRNEIKRFKQNCDTTTKQLYDLVIESLHSLWVKKYEKEEAYRRFEIYKDFEKVLFKDPRYRDHFIHQFHVFLSGLPILEKYYDNIVDTYSSIFGIDSNINIDFSWLLAATYHDIGYLVQQFDKWLSGFFKEFLDIAELPFNLDLGKLLLERNFQDYIDKLTSLYMCLYQNKEKTNWRYNGLHPMNNEFRKMLTSKLINDRNHGVISSLILLDRIEFSKAAKDVFDYKNTIFSSVVMPAGLSIALHDKAVLLDKNSNLIDFSKDPLSFILIFCDTIQEWGRPITPALTEPQEYIPYLSDFTITDSKISATLSYKKIKKIPEYDNKTTFELKDEETKGILGKLKSANPVFEITLQSLDPKYQIPDRTYKSLH